MRRPSLWTCAIRIGKYRGQTLKQIFDKDPTYLKWAIDRGMVNPIDEIQEALKQKSKGS